MSNPVNAAPVDTGTAAPAPGQAAAPVAPVSPAPSAAPSAGQPAAISEWRNVDEVRAGLKSIRELERQATAALERLEGRPAANPAPTTTQAAPAAGVDHGAVAILEVGMSMATGLDGGQQAAIRALFNAERPPATAMAGWMKDKLALFGRTAQGPATTASPATATPVAQTSVRTDLGAPGGHVAGGPLPEDPNQIPRELWKSMDRGERRALVKRYFAKKTGSDLFARPRATK